MGIMDSIAEKFTLISSMTQQNGEKHVEEDYRGSYLTYLAIKILNFEMEY